MTKINNIQSLITEKERLQRKIEDTENHLEKRIDYVRENFAELAVDHVFLPAIKHTFNMENILRMFNLSSLADAMKSGPDRNSKMVNELGSMVGKSGWLVALKVAVALIKKAFKK